MIGIYVRVSSRERAKEGYSIPAQRERLKAFCAAVGWKDYKFYIDPGISAKDMNRPELQKLITHVKEGKVKNVLVYRLDRLTRSVRDLYDFLEILEEHDCKFKSATESYDTSNAMGRMFVGLIALLAQWERENLGERVEMALEERASEFKAIGKPPYGFMIDNEYYVKTDDESEEKTLEDMIERCLNGESITGIARRLNALGTPTPSNTDVWYASTVRRILTNPAIYGAYYYGGKTTEDKLPAYVDKKTFQLIQKKLDARSVQPVRGTTKDAIFHGVASCPKCGHTLSPAVYYSKKDGRKLNYAYKCRRCRDRDDYHKSYNEKKLLRAFYEYMSNYKFVADPPKENVADDKNSELKNQIARIEKQRLKYQRAWANELMTDDEFKTLMQESQDTLDDLKAELKESGDEDRVIDINELKNIVWTFNENFSELTAIEKRTFMSRFVKSIEFEVKSEVVPNRKRPRDTLNITNLDFYA